MFPVVAATPISRPFESKLPNLKTPLFVVAMVLLGLWGWTYLRESDAFPKTALAPAQSYHEAVDPCVLADKCVVVYLAPWCSACERSIGTIHQVVEQIDGSIGVKVIVGQDTLAKVEEMARRLDCPVFVDPAGELWQELGVDGVPHWFVLDHQNRIMRDFGGTFSPIFYHMSKLGLEE